LSAGYKEQRVPSNIFLKAEALETLTLNELYKKVEGQDSFRALMLDQVTDVHNLGAIMRTAAFYNIDCVIYGKKGEERLSPGFFRVASGATEYLPLVQAGNLSKLLRKFDELGVECVGLAEEADSHDSPSASETSGKLCLVMGAEETGLSNAVRRSIEKFVSLPARGPIKSLNVSVAAALAMEKFLNQP
jgi:23S rRNA (guanosine2251-2'-O)-methyltransferase